MNAPPFDVSKAQRWFAIELNNRAWDLVEKKNRSAAETAEMIHAAHGSTYHWSQAGTPIHAMRALNLLSTVYAAAGWAEIAWEYALECSQAIDKLMEPASAFDRAAAAGALAYASILSGRCNRTPGLRLTALQLWQPLEAEERQLLERLYPLG